MVLTRPEDQPQLFPREEINLLLKLSFFAASEQNPQAGIALHMAFFQHVVEELPYRLKPGPRR